MSTYTDETRSCIDCEQAFTFSAGEQKFYFDEQGWTEGPKRCAECRRKMRPKQSSQPA